MKTKLFCALLSMVLLLCGCGGPSASVASSSPSSEPPVSEPINKVTRPDGMKLLVIGHSNTCMSAYELWPIFNNLGYENFTLGVLWRGDSTFEVHASFAKSDQKGVVYHKPTPEQFSNPDDAKNLTNYSSVLQDENWDTVVIYQGGGSFEDAEMYDKSLTNLTNIIRMYCPKAKFFYGMHWAYPVTSTTPSFGAYNFDQAAMHQASVNAAKNYILPNERISGIIPLTTLMQSLRTKYGEAFHVADLVHINTTGSFVVGMMWYAALTGLPLDNLTYIPSGVPADIVADAKAIIPRILKDPFTVIDLSQP